MRLRSSSRCSIRLMPGRSARCVTAALALPIASAASTIVGRLRRFVCVFNGGFYHCVLFLFGSLFLNGAVRSVVSCCGPSAASCPGRGNRLAG